MSRIIIGLLPTREHVDIVMSRISNFVDNHEIWFAQNIFCESDGLSESALAAVPHIIETLCGVPGYSPPLNGAVSHRTIATMLDAPDGQPDNVDPHRDFLLFCHIFNARNEGRIIRILREGGASDIKCAEFDCQDADLISKDMTVQNAILTVGRPTTPANSLTV